MLANVCLCWWWGGVTNPAPQQQGKAYTNEDVFLSTNCQVLCAMAPGCLQIGLGLRKWA